MERPEWNGMASFLLVVARLVLVMQLIYMLIVSNI